MAVKVRKSKRAEEAFQMAPMIDMVFLLLVFFMTVSTLAQAEKRVELKLPESHQSEVPADLANRGTVSIDASGQIYLGAQPVSLAELEAAIRVFVRENPHVQIHLRADQQTKYEAIRKALKACADAGAYDIIYATHQSQ